LTQAIQNVSDTAFMVAGFRATETERTNALFHDPLAAKLAGDHGCTILTTLPRRYFGEWAVVIRTVIIDAFLQQAIADGVATILNLGAGLDTRPYRMALPATLRWVEVDFTHVMELKESRLAGEKPHCRLERTRLDLTDRDARRKFLAEMNAGAKKMLVLTEGVTPYLAESDVAELADDLKGSDKIRYWVVDYYSREAIRYSEKMRARFMRNAPFRFTPQEWFGFFASHGWRPREVRYLFDEAKRLGRPMPLPWFWRLWIEIVRSLVSPARRERMNRFAAYVMLEPK
jgi:methyltransferase (TIGR00027 family)